jgi:uncharacterized membrane protein
VLVDAGVVHEVVDPAEGVDGRLDERGGVVGVTHVGADRDGVPVELAHLGGDGLGLLGALDVVDGDVVPVAGEPERHAATDAARGAGDDCCWHDSEDGDHRQGLFVARGTGGRFSSAGVVVGCMSEASHDGEAALADHGGDTAMSDMLAEFEELAELVDRPEEAEQVREARAEALAALESERVFGRVIRGFDRSDAAEALLGSVLLGIPMLVEGGTYEVGAYIATRPVFLVGTAVFATGLVAGILYVADIQDVRIYEPYLGVIPRRLAGVLTIASVTALVLATAWGRVDWAEPSVALAQVLVAAVPMAIGGALGDILPGT